MGTLAVITLVALRLGVGWHFFREGTDKILDPSWTAAHFFTGSKGPLHPLFEKLVWDVDGKARLNYSRTPGGWPTVDLQSTLALWDQYRARVADHYNFDAKQQKQAEACYRRWEEQLTWYFESNREEIVRYFQGLDRKAANQADVARQQVASLRGQSESIEAELDGVRAPWLAQVAELWRGYDEALHGVATPEQQERGRLTIGKPARGWLDTNLIDQIVPWFDATVGVLLIVGLFTRLAALAGAGFLFSIILTQWPGAPGALPTYYQTIEMLGMLVLAATAAGQFAGLDFVLYSYWSRLTQSKQEMIS
ncbi:MAG: DoxX family protein [Pirellulaceae bacterium]